MSSVPKQFIQRAPRYVLRPEDSQVVRFAHREDKSRSYSTNIIDVSTTGLAFRVHKDTQPQIGDIIMIEFTVPGAQKMACYARVIRIEEPHNRGQWKSYSDDLIIGVRFQQLLSAHTANLALGLEGKFRELHRSKKKRWITKAISWMAHHKQGVTYALLAILIMIVVFYYVTIPSGNYSPLRFVPWGERF